MHRTKGTLSRLPRRSHCPHHPRPTPVQVVPKSRRNRVCSPSLRKTKLKALGRILCPHNRKNRPPTRLGLMRNLTAKETRPHDQDFRWTRFQSRSRLNLNQGTSGGAVERGGLENRRCRKAFVGSNPTSSAKDVSPSDDSVRDRLFAVRGSSSGFGKTKYPDVASGCSSCWRDP